MKKRFNTVGLCIPNMHYMVNIDNKLEKIKMLIDRKDYFVINRPRQYGKTTTMYMLEQMLKEEYLVISVSFEGIGDSAFLSEEAFSKIFIDLITDSLEFVDDNLAETLSSQSKEIQNLRDLSKAITNFIKKCNKEVVLFIDEVDKSSDNQLFLSFLGMLRNKYLMRQQGKDKTFSSVILAGVYDIKNLKLKMQNDKEVKYNSPWNIAVNFDIDMSFSIDEIQTMLKEYKIAENIEMDTLKTAERIYYYTNGYPFLVSRLCEIVNENIRNENIEKWSYNIILLSLKKLIAEKNTLFDDLIKNLNNYNNLKEYLFNLIINGEERTFNIHNETIDLGVTFGYLRNDHEKVKVSNRIFEQVLYDYFSSRIETEVTSMKNYNFKDNFLTLTGLDFKKVLLRFQQFIKEQYSTLDSDFIEREGRLLFLAFIKPIINGTGFDFKEVQISEEKRLDIVVTYLKEKYIVELKVWRGEKYHEKGLKQLAKYLENQSLNEGYLLIYNFNKNKEYKREEVVIEGKKIFVVWV